MRYWLDAEFMEDGERIIPLSIGIAAEDGRTFYEENADADWTLANDWVVEHVLIHLGQVEARTKQRIAVGILDFVEAGGEPPEFWGYFSDYDWVLLCQFYGRMVDLPEGWPMFCLDLKQEVERLGNPMLPPQLTIEHHAGNDSVWTREAHLWLIDEHRHGTLTPRKAGWQ